MKFKEYCLLKYLSGFSWILSKITASFSLGFRCNVSLAQLEMIYVDFNIGYLNIGYNFFNYRRVTIFFRKAIVNFTAVIWEIDLDLYLWWELTCLKLLGAYFSGWLCISLGWIYWKILVYSGTGCEGEFRVSVR